MDMSPLFETIINHIPAPEGDPDAETQVLISTIDYNEFVGRIASDVWTTGDLKGEPGMCSGKPPRAG